MKPYAAREMAGKLVNAQAQHSHVLLYCPLMDKQVARNEWKSFTSADGEVIWWHCSACGGWHIKAKKHPNT